MAKYKPGGPCGGWGIFFIAPGIPNVVEPCPGCDDCKDIPEARRAAARAAESKKK